MLRQPLLMLSRSDKVKSLVTAMPVSSGIVSRYVPGEATEDAVKATGELIESGLHVTLDFLGEDTLDREQADATVAAYVDVLGALSDQGLSRNAEVSVKLSAVGQALPGDGEKVAVENARTICHAARNAGTTVTLDMEDHTTTDSTLGILRELRKDFPETGAVLQAYLRRTEADCRDLAYEGSRVRLCKGAYNEPESVAFADQARRGPRLRARPQGADGRAGLPDDRHPRPADGRHRRGAGDPVRPRAGQLRVPDALRHPPRRAAPAGRGRREGPGLRALRPGVVRLPDAPARRAPQQPDLLRPLADLQES